MRAEIKTLLTEIRKAISEANDKCEETAIKEHPTSPFFHAGQYQALSWIDAEIVKILLVTESQPPAGLPSDEEIKDFINKAHFNNGSFPNGMEVAKWMRSIAEQRIAEYREAMQEFCDRVDRGEVKSKYTYSKFKQLLNK